MEKIFDYIVIVVSNNFQKKLINKNIYLRKKLKLIPTDTKYIIMIEKEKIGSGGAVFNLIKYFQKYYIKNEKFYQNKKILLINSGGESKRNILYSDKGKICIPTFKKLKNHLCSIVFDEIMLETHEIGKKISQGLLIVSGDCTTYYKNIRKREIEKSTVFSVKSKINVGEKHGVFLSKDGILINFLHKKTKTELKKMGAVDSKNNVNLDVGIIYLNPKIIKKLKLLVTTKNKIDLKKFRQFANPKIKLNVYADFLYPFAKNANLDEYLQQPSETKNNSQLTIARHKLWDTFNNESMYVINLEKGNFIHWGTIREFRKETFKKFKEKQVIINSKILNQSIINKGCYIENSIIDNSIIGKNTIIIDSYIKNMKVPDNIILKTVKLKENEFVSIIVGLTDDIKQSGKNIKIFGKEIEKSKENETLWNFKIYKVRDTMESSTIAAIDLYNNIKEGKNYKIFSLSNLSIEQIFKLLD